MALVVSPTTNQSLPSLVLSTTTRPATSSTSPSAGPHKAGTAALHHGAPSRLSSKHTSTSTPRTSSSPPPARCSPPTSTAPLCCARSTRVSTLSLLWLLLAQRLMLLLVRHGHSASLMLLSLLVPSWDAPPAHSAPTVLVTLVSTLMLPRRVDP